MLRRLYDLITSVHVVSYLRVAYEVATGHGVNETRFTEFLEVLTNATNTFDICLQSTDTEEVVRNVTSVFQHSMPSITESKWNAVLQQYLRTSTSDVDAIAMPGLQSFAAVFGLPYISSRRQKNRPGSTKCTASETCTCSSGTSVNNFLLNGTEEIKRQVITGARRVRSAFLDAFRCDSKSFGARPEHARIVDDSLKAALALLDAIGIQAQRFVYESYPAVNSGRPLLNHIAFAEHLARLQNRDERGTAVVASEERRFPRRDFGDGLAVSHRHFVLNPYHLHFPWYVERSPRSVLYAGIGSRLAATLLFDCIEKSFECRAVTDDTNECLAASEANRHATSVQELQAALVGITVAWRALNDDVNNATPHAVEASPHHASTLNAVQVDGLFFAFGCYYYCGEEGGEELCNVPLKHNAEFARVFECPPDSPMNPERKCPVLA
ncbi:hypothetical protein HPB50_005377 [Hyalomma asiaticum]|uniref:Uncharacterized protein n=1 Tax=Hyalomma asiaticum TaxID=266040 RepID=A0ACB7RLS5_HYAAI|nr:hypothetical protein HPB50_005377 [Hyalomma asiaticum]